MKVLRLGIQFLNLLLDGDFKVKFADLCLECPSAATGMQPGQRSLRALSPTLFSDCQAYRHALGLDAYVPNPSSHTHVQARSLATSLGFVCKSSVIRSNGEASTGAKGLMGPDKRTWPTTNSKTPAHGSVS